jgi:uncharacterized membrane protein
MSIELYIAILLTIVVLSILAGAVALVVTLLQLKRTASAIEMAAVRAGDQIGRVGDMAGSLGQVALGIAGTMGRKTVMGAGLLYSLFRFIRQGHKKKNPLAEEEDDSNR